LRELLEDFRAGGTHSGEGCIQELLINHICIQITVIRKPGRFSKEAMYQVQTPKGIRCMICPNECNIQEGSSGDCGNRKNFGGKLYSIAYGNPCAVHVDPVEKKPLMHFYPESLAFSIATAGCNLACLNCQN
jgi:pyruvate formate lyase activating enzyme